FVYVRNRIQRLLTKVIFLRSNVEEVLRELHHLGRAAPSDVEFLSGAAESVARFLHAEQFFLIEEPPGETPSVSTPSAVLDPAKWKLPSWVQAVVPLRLSRGDTRLLLLGPRQGGRRYL